MSKNYIRPSGAEGIPHARTLANIPEDVNDDKHVTQQRLELPAYQIARRTRWPHTILVDFYPRDETAEGFRTHAEAAMAEACGYMPQQIALIEHVRSLGLDRGAPERLRHGISYGHLMVQSPIFLDVRLDPCAATPQMLVEQPPAIIEWLMNALRIAREEAAK